MHFKIGVVTKPHGIKGGVRVYPTTDEPERFRLLADETVTVGECQRRIDGARLSKGMVIVKFHGVNDRNAAQALTGKSIYIPQEKALPLAEDEYFERDIIGLAVETEEGLFLGCIQEILKTRANDVYTVRPDEGRAFMIPAVKNVVVRVSISERKMTVRLVEGMEGLVV